MSNQIAPKNPAEVINISPEALEVANTYLELQDILAVASKLNIESSQVSQILGRREIKAYIDHIFQDYGFNNRFKLRNIMDTVIAKKLEEMEEADIGSGKDITEILALSHKMTMDVLNAQIKLEQIRSNNTIKNQTNVQINNPESTNLNMLVTKLKENS